MHPRSALATYTTDTGLITNPVQRNPISDRAVGFEIGGEEWPYVDTLQLVLVGLNDLAMSQKGVSTSVGPVNGAKD